MCMLLGLNSVLIKSMLVNIIILYICMVVRRTLRTLNHCKKEEETSKIRVAVLESKYASLVDHGVPLSVSLQLQQLAAYQAQWTTRHSLGGFSISFWPALDSCMQK